MKSSPPPSSTPELGRGTRGVEGHAGDLLRLASVAMRGAMDPALEPARQRQPAICSSRRRHNSVLYPAPHGATPPTHGRTLEWNKLIARQTLILPQPAVGQVANERRRVLEKQSSPAMLPEIIQFGQDGQARWAGMGDFVLVSPDQSHRVELIYTGEPPHGDSYHRAIIDGVAFPGEVWGGQFAFSACSRHLVFSWMPRRFERRSVVVDLQDRRYFVLPGYIDPFSVRWPSVVGEGKLAAGKEYTFDGAEHWPSY